MGLLDFLGPLKPFVVIVIWITIIISWFFAIIITIFVPLAFLFTIPWMIILGFITIFAMGGLYIAGKRDLSECRLEDGNLVCDI